MPRAPASLVQRGARRAALLSFALASVGVAPSAQADEPDADEEGWEIGDGSEPAAEPPPADEAEAAPEGDAQAEPASPPATPAPSVADGPIVLVPVPGMAPPPGFVEDRYSNEKFLVSGLLLTLGGQVGSIALSAAMFDESEVGGEVFALGFLPIAGPFALTAYEHVPTFARPLYALIGSAQLAGLALDFAAGFSPQRLWKQAPSTGQPAPVQVKAGPTAVSLSARF